MITFDNFKNEWLNRRIIDPILIGHGETAETAYQCVSLIKQYMLEVKGLRVDYPGNAIDFWRHTVKAIEDDFPRVFDGTIAPGDMAVFKTNGYTGTPDTDPGYGHIGIATGAINGGQMQILEQNGQTGGGTGTGGDAIRLRWIDRGRLAGLLRPKADTPPPPPTSASYTVTETYSNGKQVKLNKDTNLWGMNYHFDFMVAHPVETGHKQGEIWTVTNKVHHEDGYDYYRRDGQVDGFNVLDCADYVPPPPPPPAAPVVVTKAETLPLVTDLLCYAKAVNAMQATTPTGELRAGTYFVWDRQLGAVNLSTSNMTDQQRWVNEKLNVAAIPVLPPKITETIKEAATLIPPPAPAPVASGVNWRVTKSLRQDGKPVHFRFMNTQPIQIFDLEGKQSPIDVQPYNGGVSGAFVQEFWKENSSGELVHYLRADKVAKNFWFYGVPVGYLEQIEDVPLDINHDGSRDISDITALGQDFLDYGMSAVHKLGAWDKSIHVSAKTKQFAKGVIDGFIRRKKQ